MNSEELHSKVYHAHTDIEIGEVPRQLHHQEVLERLGNPGQQVNLHHQEVSGHVWATQDTK